jgi:hypothetical protein
MQIGAFPLFETPPVLAPLALKSTLVVNGGSQTVQPY